MRYVKANFNTTYVNLPTSGNTICWVPLVLAVSNAKRSSFCRYNHHRRPEKPRPSLTSADVYLKGPGPAKMPPFVF